MLPDIFQFPTQHHDHMSKFSCSASALLTRLQGDEKFYQREFSLEESEDELYDQFEDQLIEEETMEFPNPHSSASSTSSEPDETFDENECSICYLEVEMETLTCGHRFCTDCLGQYLTLMIRRDEPQTLSHTVYKIEPCSGGMSVNKCEFYGVKCPAKSCKYIMEHEVLQQYVDEATLTQFAWNGLRRCLISLNQWGHCAKKSCTGRLVVDLDGALRCSICMESVCCRCHEAPHPGLTCEQHRQARLDAQQSHDKLLEYAVKNHILCCPKCYCAIEKNGGCTHMHCTRCGTHFDWTTAPFFGTGQHWYSNPRSATILRQLKLTVPTNSATSALYQLSNSEFVALARPGRAKGARRRGVTPICITLS